MITRREAFRLGGRTTLAVIASTGALAVSREALPAPATERDPMLVLIAEYRRQFAVYDQADENSDEENDALAAATFQPVYLQLRDNPPEITTHAGAVEALRLASEEMEHSHGSFERPLVNAALAFFDRRPS